MQTLEPIIAEHPFFKALDPKHLAVITGCAKNVRFKAGAVIFREEEAADLFYLIREGNVALEASIPGHGPVLLQTVGASEVLGWSWLFPPYRWHLTARTLEPTRALAFDGKCLRNKCDEDHNLGYELMKRFAGIMLQRLQATRLQLLDVYGGYVA